MRKSRAYARLWLHSARLRLPTTVSGVDVEAAIRTRRTHKAYRQEPVSREVLDELFELASWAPNHNLTVPWRFRVVGPQALERLKEAAGPEAAAKLDRAPTLVVVSSVQTGEPVQDDEDLHSTAVAAYIVLLARPCARARRLLANARASCASARASRRSAFREAERFVGLLHLGEVFEPKPAPERPDTARRRHLPRLGTTARLALAEQKGRPPSPARPRSGTSS